MKKIDPDFEYIKSRKNLVNSDGSVNYGSFDKPLNLNFHDYKLKTFFGKEASKCKTRNALKKFNYYSIATKDYVLAVGFVKLYFFYSCFIYVFEKDKGIVYKDSADIIGSKKAKYIGDNYDFTIDWHTRNYKKLFKVNKSADGFIKIQFAFGEKIKGTATAKIPSKYERLMVCNPASLTRWTFTEKMYAIPVKEANVRLNGKLIIKPSDHPLLSSDWSAGFFRKETTWIWWAGQGKVDKHYIGFNFATFINDAMYPERAVWIDNKKYEIPHLLFDVDFADPYKGVKVFTKDGKINLTFKPIDVKTDIENRFNFIKSNFRQYVGYYNGTINVDGTTYNIKDMNGFFELHDSIW